MTDAKVKLSRDAVADHARLAIIHRVLGPGARLRGDANNLFQTADKCIAHLHAAEAGFWAIEEPLAARDFVGMRKVATETNARIILDESATKATDLGQIEGTGWIVNLRVSKLGGLLRSFEMLRIARQRDLGVILGCHVGETGILTRAALTLASACNDELIAAECGYGGYLLSRDLTRPRIRFGSDGVLRAPFGSDGLSVDVRNDLLVPIGESPGRVNLLQIPDP